MPEYVVWICENCRVGFKGQRRYGVSPKFCSRECHYAFKRKPSQIKKRFWSNVDVGSPEECWLWISGTFSGGYGHFNYIREPGKEKSIRAHRFAYKITQGKIPKGILVCHRCDTPLCCNPHHLFLGTSADNSLDMIRKGRDRKSRGESNGRAKLTEKDIKNILRLRENGYALQTIAGIYGIVNSQVSQICLGKAWSHVRLED